MQSSPFPPPFLSQSRWKLLRTVLLRLAAGKVAAGWTKWLEVSNMQKLTEDRVVWRRLGMCLYERTGLGLFSQLVHRWKLLRKVILRARNLRVAQGWSKWIEVSTWIRVQIQRIQIQRVRRRRLPPLAPFPPPRSGLFSFEDGYGRLAVCAPTLVLAEGDDRAAPLSCTFSSGSNGYVPISIRLWPRMMSL